jgi:glycosyltransferase involved in cell wall biosynthesis
MKQPVLSVVIPTRDRRGVLMTTLRALAAQRDVKGPLEVIVADDGSTDGSAELVRGSVFEAFDLKVLRLQARGPAHARNRGIEAATAPRVLLLGDDTIPVKGTAAAHLVMAGGREVAVQGRIDWDPQQPVTEVMAFLAPAGPQFWFRDLINGGPVPWMQVLGSNLSAPRDWFLEEPFDERFTEACMEDTELSWRWRRRGWQVVWCSRSGCRHRHHYDAIEPFLDRQRRTGRWARLAVKTHPRLFFRLVAQPVAMFPGKYLAARLGSTDGQDRRSWDLRCRLSFLRGFLGV